MQISSFLLPKEKVTYVLASDSMLTAMTKLEHHNYTAIPIIDEEGKYIGTLSEGDLLWKMKGTPGLTFETMDEVPVSNMRKRIFNESVVIDAHMEDMLTLAADQNFVPVIDHKGVFLGIIRRKDIIEYYTRNITD